VLAEELEEEEGGLRSDAAVLVAKGVSGKSQKVVLLLRLGGEEGDGVG
jgi:hypothetical protein